MNIADIRKEYTLQSLDEQDVNSNPFLQFNHWLKEAVNAALPEPTAMVLATAHGQRPSARVVLLKGVTPAGFVFFTNYESRKAQELAENPFAAINFHWAELERQVRIEGSIQKISEAESAEYFFSRPEGSRIGAWASPQSRKLASRQALEHKIAELTALYAGKEIPKPDFWGGYELKPTYFEFWQGRASRLHDRIIYEQNPSGWTISRLAP